MKKQTRGNIIEHTTRIDVYIELIREKLDGIYPPPATNHVEKIKDHLDHMSECTECILRQV